MQVILGKDDWSSVADGINRRRLTNMFVTENPANPDGLSFVGRPSLSSELEVGSDPVVGIWRQAGTFGGDWFFVSGNTLYRYDLSSVTEIGFVVGTGPAFFEASLDRLLILRDGIVYSYDGTTLSLIVMPNDELVKSIAYINEYFLLTVQDSQVFYWIEPGQINPDGLSFASAERFPDYNEAVATILDEVWFLGTKGPEVWAPTGDADLPFSRLNGRVYDEGCLSGSSVAEVSYNSMPALMWVTDTRSVVLVQGAPKKVSSKSIDGLLETATNLRGWFFRYLVHDFYVLTSDQFTVVYDIKADRWSDWNTYGMPFWVADNGSQADSIILTGDRVTGKVWRLIESGEDETLPIIREVSGRVHLLGKPVRCDNLSLKLNVGRAVDYEDDATLEVRWSDDQGSTWSRYRSVNLGARGIYGKTAYIRSLGVMDVPGRDFEFRFSGRSRFRLDYVTINEI